MEAETITEIERLADARNVYEGDPGFEVSDAEEGYDELEDEGDDDLYDDADDDDYIDEENEDF